MVKAYVARQRELAEIVISAPRLNLFDAQMVADVEAAVTEVGRLCRAGEARAMLLRAEGKIFCGGVDVHEFQGISTADGARLMARFLTLVQTIEALPMPTMALVQGLNLTIGFELSLGCDLMWAADDASFGLVEPSVGLTPGGGGSQRLVARAGYARAAELVMTGEVYRAATMCQWGVVNRVLPAAELLDSAREFMTVLAAGPTAATAAGKRLMLVARDHGIAAADAITAREMGPLFATEDLPAGLTSLLENGPRRATFVGR
jgi:enoyl-CoA hydratase/carnithine racemase